MVLAAREYNEGVRQRKEFLWLERGAEGELGPEGGMVGCPSASVSCAITRRIGWPGLGLRFCVSHEHPRDADVACLFPTLPAASVDITEVLC